MNSFDTLDELWLDVAAQVKNDGKDVGSRDGASREILGFVSRLNNPFAHFMFNPIRKASPSYAAAEFLWYLSGDNSIERILPYAPQYERFADNGIANGAYGHRWKNAQPSKFHHEGSLGFDQLVKLKDLLKFKPETRQAVITMYHPSDLFRAEISKDIPCTIALNFIVRDGKLNLIATMRSNDLWLGLPYDVFCFCALQILMAYDLGLQVGFYQHQATSLHVYERNREKFEAALATPAFATGPMTYGRNGEGRILEEKVDKALHNEQWNRNEKVLALSGIEELGAGSLLSELVIMAAVKFDFTQTRAREYLSNKLMQKYVEEFFSKPKEKKPNLFAESAE